MQEILHAKLSTSGASHSGRKFSMRQPNYPRLSPLPTTVMGRACLGGYNKLGKRAFVLEAIRKQLRYLAGRQVRCLHLSSAWLLARANRVLDSEYRYTCRKYCYCFPYFGS